MEYYLDIQIENNRIPERKNKRKITKFFKVPGHKNQCNQIEKAYRAHRTMDVIKPTPMPDSRKLYITKVLRVEKSKFYTKNQEQNDFGLANTKADTLTT